MSATTADGEAENSSLSNSIDLMLEAGEEAMLQGGNVSKTLALCSSPAPSSANNSIQSDIVTLGSSTGTGAGGSRRIRLFRGSSNRSKASSGKRHQQQRQQPNQDASSAVVTPATGIAKEDFLARVREEEARVMAEFGLLGSTGDSHNALASNVTNNQNQNAPLTAIDVAQSTSPTFLIPMIGDVHDVSDDMSGTQGNETGTTSTGDIHFTQSEWVTKFGGGQMEQPVRSAKQIDNVSQQRPISVHSPHIQKHQTQQLHSAPGVPPVVVTPESVARRNDEDNSIPVGSVSTREGGDGSNSSPPGPVSSISTSCSGGGEAAVSGSGTRRLNQTVDEDDDSSAQPFQPPQLRRQLSAPFQHGRSTRASPGSGGCDSINNNDEDASAYSSVLEGTNIAFPSSDASSTSPQAVHPRISSGVSGGTGSEVTGRSLWSQTAQLSSTSSVVGAVGSNSLETNLSEGKIPVAPVVKDSQMTAEPKIDNELSYKEENRTTAYQRHEQENNAESSVIDNVNDINSSSSTHSERHNRVGGSVLVPSKFDREPDDSVMGITPLGAGGWSAIAAERRTNLLVGSLSTSNATIMQQYHLNMPRNDSQSDMYVSESEASSAFDEAANNNFPSSILGSAGIAPAALMATSNWSQSGSGLHRNQQPFPSIYNRKSNSSLLRSSEESSLPTTTATAMPTRQVAQNLHSDYNNDGNNKDTVDNNKITYPRDDMDFLASTEDLDDGNQADDEKQWLSLDGHNDQQQQQLSNLSQLSKNSDKPYNRSVRGQSARSKYSLFSSNSLAVNAGNSSSDNNSISQHRKFEDMDESAVVGVASGIDGEGDDDPRQNLMYSVPYDMVNMGDSSNWNNSAVGGTVGHGRSPAPLPNSNNISSKPLVRTWSSSSSSAMGSEHQIEAAAMRIALAVKGATDSETMNNRGQPGRTTSIGSSGLVNKNSTNSPINSLLSNNDHHNSKMKEGSNEVVIGNVISTDQSMSVNTMNTSSRDRMQMSTLAALGGAIAAETSVGIASARESGQSGSGDETLDLSSVTSAASSIPGKQGTGGLYQITSIIPGSASVSTSSSTNDNYPKHQNKAQVLISGAGAGFNVGQLSTSATTSQYGTVQHEKPVRDGKYSNFIAMIDDIENGTQNFDDDDDGLQRGDASTGEGDTKPLGMIIVRSKSVTGISDDGTEDISVLQGFRSGTSQTSLESSTNLHDKKKNTGSSVDEAGAGIGIYDSKVGSTMSDDIEDNLSEDDDISNHTPVGNIWHQKVCGVRVDRLVLVLAITVVLSLGIVVGSVVAQQRREGGKGGNDSAIGSENILTSAPINLLGTSSPVALMPVAKTPPVVPISVPMRAPSTLINSIPPTAMLRTATPTNSMATLQPSSIEFAQRTVMPTIPCVDSDTEEFFAGLGIGVVNCTWLSTRPGHAQRLCVSGEEAFDACRLTCNNCNISGGVTRTNGTASREPTGVDTPEATVVSTTVSTTIPTFPPSAFIATSIVSTTVSTKLSTSPPSIITTMNDISTISPTNAVSLNPTIAVTMRMTMAPSITATETPSAVAFTETTFPTKTLTSSPTLKTSSMVTADATPSPSILYSFTVEKIKTILTTASPQSRAALNNQSSPQARALAWLGQSFADGTLVSGDFTDERLVSVWALATLAISAQSNKWMDQTGWLNEPNECNWEGVVCNDDGTVGEINLVDQNLSGSLPAEIALFPDLRVLDVSTNTLNGKIPSTLGQLTNIDTLRLDRNEFRGTLPTSITRLTQLEFFTFERNSDLSGTFPSGLAEITTLRTLSFYYTSLTGTVPAAMCNFVTELVLDCRQVESTCWTRCFYRCGGDTGITCL